MTAATRTRSRSRTAARTSAHRASGGLSPRAVALGSVAAVALVLGLVLGFLLMRPSGTSAPTATPVAEGTPAVEVALPTAENPGPVRNTNGIPSGFLRGPSGAVAAANAFSQLAVEAAPLDSAALQGVARSVIVPGADANAGFVVPTGFLREQIGARSDTALRTVPLGSQVTALTPERATVRVWFGVLSANQQGTQTAGGVVPSLAEASFFTSTVSLAYRSGDWRLAGLAVTAGPGVGLTPDNTLDPAALADQLRGFAPFVYLPPQGGAQ